MMLRYVLKILLSAVVIATVSEVGKRSSMVAAILASLPVTSILALIWLYSDTGDVTKVSALSTGIFWAVLPSFLFFLSLPFLLKNGVRFPLAMVLSIVLMFAGYTGYTWILKQMGVEI